MEFYSMVKKNNILKFSDKWKELIIIVILSEVTQTQKKTSGICSLSLWI